MNDQNNLDIKTPIIESILKIFDTMLSMEVEYIDIKSPDSSMVDMMAGVVHITGDMTGTLRIQVPAELARMMLAGKGGANVEDLKGNGGIHDLLAEVLKHLGNHLKIVLCGGGLSCEISTPSISEETDAPLDPTQLENYEKLEFRHGDQTFQVEVGIKRAEQSQTADLHDGADKEKNNGDPAGDQEDLDSLNDLDLNVILDIPIELTVELGRTRILIHELLQLGPGSAIPLSKLEREPVDILANDTLIARGQVVVQDEKYGIRVTEITSRMDRIRSLS